MINDDDCASNKSGCQTKQKKKRNFSISLHDEKKCPEFMIDNELVFYILQIITIHNVQMFFFFFFWFYKLFVFYKHLKFESINSI